MHGTVSPGLVHRIRDLALSLRDDPRSDAELLAAFVRGRDEGAFAALVARHRRVVWDTCRLALGNDADAEDAFQAVFIALARDARKVRAESLGGWLRTVSQRASTNARVAARRREAAHRRLYERTAPAIEAAPDDDDLRTAVREELAVLPEPLRVPLTLYYLEGKNQADVGRILGVTDRAAAARLRRGLTALRGQLARRGMAVSSVSLATILGGVVVQSAEAAVPAGLVAAATDLALAAADGRAPGSAAARLAAGLSGPAGLGRAKLYGLVLAFAGLGVVSGAVVWADRPPAEEKAPPAMPEVPPAPARADRLGDALPAGALTRIGTNRFRAGRASGTEDVAFFPDGRLVASVHGGSEVRLWETATGKPARTLDAPTGARWVATDGRKLAVAGLGEVWVWDLGANEPRVLWKWRVAHVPPQPSVVGLALSPDGGTVAVGDREGKCTRLFRAGTGEEIETLAGQPLAMSATASGKYLAVIGGRDSAAWADRLVFWDAAAGRPARVLDAPAGELFIDVALSADGRALVRTAKGAVRLVDVATGRESGTWSGRDGARRGLAFLPGSKDAIEVETGHVRFRNPATGAEALPALAIPALVLYSLNQNYDMTKHVSPDGKYLAVPCYGELVLWDLVTGRPAHPPGQVQGSIRAVSFSPNSRSLLTFADRASEVRVWNAETGEPGAILAVPAAESLVGLGWGPDGRTLTLGRSAKPAGPGFLVRSDPRTGTEGERVPLPAGHTWPNGGSGGNLAPFAVTPSGGRTAVASGKEIDVLDPAGAVVRRLTARELVTRLTLSADGRTLGVVTNKWLPRQPGSGPRPPVVGIELWDVASGRPRPAAANTADWDLFQTTPALSADGRWLAAATWEHAVTLSEVGTGRAGQRFECPGRPQCLAFSPDGRLLAAGDGEGAVTVWDLATGRAVRRFTGHRGQIAAVAFAPDGRRLASGSADGTALVWDLAGLAPARVSRQSGEQLCDALFGTDAAAAHRAGFSLADQPDEAIRLLALRTVRPTLPARADMERWITELEDDAYATRERAEASLERAGEAAGPALLKGLAGSPSAEARARLQRLVARLEADTNPARVTGARAIAVLERIGTPAARKALQSVIERSGPAVKADAEAALQRMSEGPAPR